MQTIKQLFLECNDDSLSLIVVDRRLLCHMMDVWVYESVDFALLEREMEY